MTVNTRSHIRFYDEHLVILYTLDDICWAHVVNISFNLYPKDQTGVLNGYEGGCERRINKFETNLRNFQKSTHIYSAGLNSKLNPSEYKTAG